MMAATSRRRLLASLPALLLSAVAFAAPAPVTITFYHTSDLHEHPARLPRIARLVASQRQAGKHVLLVDTGDWFNKGDLTPLNTRGEAIVELMGACGYDAVIPGNHDYSFGTKRLAELVDRYKIPLRVANAAWPATATPACAKPYAIHALGGVRVAIVGTATPNREQATDTLLEIRPVEPAVRKTLKTLEGKADIVVLLTHLGPPADRKLVKALPRVDILFGGHHHKRFAKLDYEEKTKTVLQHSGCFGDWLGELTVTWDGTKIVDRKVRLVRITDEMPEDARVRAIATRYLSRAGGNRKR